MQPENVVIIIPTYNEGEGIEHTIEEVIKHTENQSECTESVGRAPGPTMNYNIQLLVFDSASTDDTQAKVKALQKKHANLTLLTEPQKSGLGSAYHQAMQYALNTLNADIVFEFDADLSHQPKYLLRMVEALKTHDVVVGSRYVQGGSIPSDWGWHRKALSVLGNWVARLALTQKIKDFTSGFRATRKNALKEALPEQFISSAYAYKVELLWRLYKNGASIEEYPIEFVDRKKGYSKLPTNSISDTLRVLFTLRAKPFLAYVKMCAVGFIGLGVQVAVYNLARLELSPFRATQIAVACAMLNNYLLNDRFTFTRPSHWTKRHKLRSISLFIGYSLMMIFCQSHWLKWITKHFGTGLLIENTALITGIVLFSVINYLVYSRIVWQQHKLKSSA